MRQGLTGGRAAGPCGPWGAVRRNPYFLRELWAFRRGQTWRDLSVLGTVLAFSLIFLVASDYFDTTVHFEWFESWLVFATAIWIIVGALNTVSLSSAAFHSDRQAGTLPLLSLTPVRSWDEVVGRWAGRLLPVAIMWLLGLVLVVGGVLGEWLLVHPMPRHVPPSPWAVALTFGGAWCVAGAAFAAVGALGTLMATVVGKPSRAAAATLGISATLLWSTWTWCFATFAHLAGYGGVPPAETPIFVFPGGALPGVITAIFWLSLFLVLGACARCALALAAALVGRGAHFLDGRDLSGAIRPIAAGAQAPLSRPGSVRSEACTSTRTGAGGSLSGSDRARGGGIAGSLLRAHAQNPFYVAWRQGQVRLERRFSGSFVPPLILGASLLVYFGACAKQMPGTSGQTLVAGVILASLVSGCEGFLLAARTIRSEREQSTWPLIVVSGVRPEVLVAGRFAACFHSLSGEWTVLLPLWLLVSLLHPPAVLLAVVQPAVIALAILVGLVSIGGPYVSDARLLARLGLLLLSPLMLLGLFPLSHALAWEAIEFAAATFLVPRTLYTLASPGTSGNAVAATVSLAVNLFVLWLLCRWLWLYGVEAVRGKMIEP